MCFLRFALAALALSLPPTFAIAKGNPVRGERIARENCAPCHAIGRTGASPSPTAPRFRELGKRYSLRDLEEGLAEGLVVGHGKVRMPEFQLGAEEIDNLISYLQRIQARRR